MAYENRFTNDFLPLNVRPQNSMFSLSHPFTTTSVHAFNNISTSVKELELEILTSKDKVADMSLFTKLHFSQSLDVSLGQ